MEGGRGRAAGALPATGGADFGLISTRPSLATPLILTTAAEPTGAAYGMLLKDYRTRLSRSRQPTNCPDCSAVGFPQSYDTAIRIRQISAKLQSTENAPERKRKAALLQYVRDLRMRLLT